MLSGTDELTRQLSSCDPEEAKEWRVVQLSSTEQRREDPLIVTLYSIEGQHGISPAATGYSDEWTGSIVSGG